MTPSQESYRDGIAALDDAIEVLDEPGRGLGVAWGLQRGQWGHLQVARARDILRDVRDAMVREELARERTEA